MIPRRSRITRPGNARPFRLGRDILEIAPKKALGRRASLQDQTQPSPPKNVVGRARGRRDDVLEQRLRAELLKRAREGEELMVG